jgi:hypothetical protein
MPITPRETPEQNPGPWDQKDNERIEIPSCPTDHLGNLFAQQSREILPESKLGSRQAFSPSSMGRSSVDEPTIGCLSPFKTISFKEYLESPCKDMSFNYRRKERKQLLK